MDKRRKRGKRRKRRAINKEMVGFFFFILMVSFSATYAQRAPWYGLFSEVFNSCDWVKLGLHLGHGGSSLQGHKLPFTLTLTAHLELFFQEWNFEKKSFHRVFVIYGLYSAINSYLSKHSSVWCQQCHVTAPEWAGAFPQSQFKTPTMNHDWTNKHATVTVVYLILVWRSSM